MGELGDHRNIDQFKHWVRWRLEEHGLGLLAQSNSPDVWIVASYKFNFHAPLWQELRKHNITRAKH